MSDNEPKTSNRRTQNQRSQEMRQRLIDATLKCLEQDGYAGTTISRIIEVAGVSRGAPVHHFASKHAMIAAAAEQLIKRIYLQMGATVNSLEQSDDRLADLILASWRKVFDQPEYKALTELLLASSRDEKLAAILQKLWTMGYTTVGVAAEHYLEPLSPQDDVGKMIMLTQWLLRGMALDRHLVADHRLYDNYLMLWSRVLAKHLRAKPNVTSLPARPDFWDISFADTE